MRPWIVAGLFLALAFPRPGGATFTTFESGQVRPLAMSPDGTRLFAVNTPDDRLEIFSPGPGSLTPIGSVTVGLEPVAVAARTNTEVWVVNHLSDSVSIVDVGSVPPRVVRTLMVGDEPRDIVFAGPGGNRAFITTAHRGQNSPVDPQLTTPGVGRADVFVFDALNLGSLPGGTPLTVVTLFGDTPRALAVAPGGGTVYAAVFESGNQTTSIHEGAVCNGGSSAAPCTVDGHTMPGGLPAPNTNFQGTPGPETGLIVKFDQGSSQWEDRLGRNWSGAVKFSLPDRDVFSINANATPPVQSGFWADVGTVLFNMVANPVSGRVYVSNTDAHNEVRFEGPGVFGGSTVRGHLHEARITVLDGAAVNPRHLNPHINYGIVPSPAGVSDKSLATPTGMAVTSDGTTLYVAAFGSGVVGVFSTSQLEGNTFVPSIADHISLTGGGPSGLVLDEPRGQLYVLTRFDDAVSVVDTATRMEVAHVPVHNPEPASVVNGRRFLYDASYTSSNGEASCSSCHVFGDFDSLGWDLGNPDDVVKTNPNPFRVTDPIGLSFNGFHPLKGPMTTQTLRGMANDGPMHWRGDRTGGSNPGGDPLDEDAAFKAFNVAFNGLLGRSGPLDADEMQAFTDFVLQVTLPPNPIRNLDDSLTSDQQSGRNFFMGGVASDVFQPCHGCHVLDPANGNFGTDGLSSFEFEAQEFKIPHLRNLYEKVGMFGMVGVPFFNPGDNGNKGNQVRGFGFLHDGSVDTLFRFHNSQVFNQTNPAGFPIPNPGGFLNGTVGDPLRRQVEQFMLAFDTNLAPMVGQQVTLTSATFSAGVARLAFVESRAAAGDCELTAKGTVAGEERGWVLTPDGFRSDRSSEPLLTDAQLRVLAAVPGQELTYTCVPPGSGVRVGIDRDEDGWLDRDEIDLGTDPGDPNSVPAVTTTTVVTSTTTSTTAPAFITIAGKLTLRDDDVAPITLKKRKVVFKADTPGATSGHHIVVPNPSFPPSDPRLQGATLVVYNSNPFPGSPLDAVTVTLPAVNWSFNAGVFQYEYHDLSVGAPISYIKLKPDHLLVRGGTAGWGYTLDEPSQGSVAVQLIFAPVSQPFQYCADLPAKATGVPPSTATHDHVDKFDGLAKTPPLVCPSMLK